MMAQAHGPSSTLESNHSKTSTLEDDLQSVSTISGSGIDFFRKFVKKQKQLIAYIESYSFIIRNLAREPSERFLQHFMKIGSIGVNNHRKLYNKYRWRFYEALAQLSMSLSNF